MHSFNFPLGTTDKYLFKTSPIFLGSSYRWSHQSFRWPILSLVLLIYPGKFLGFSFARRNLQMQNNLSSHFTLGCGRNYSIQNYKNCSHWENVQNSTQDSTGIVKIWTQVIGVLLAGRGQQTKLGILWKKTIVKLRGLHFERLSEGSCILGRRLLVKSNSPFLNQRFSIRFSLSRVC